MNYNFGNEISASEAIRHMRLRLSAEQVPSIDVQMNTIADTDKMIEHIRSQLYTSSHQRCRRAFSPYFQFTQSASIFRGFWSL